jgi:hypothetical protein
VVVVSVFFSHRYGKGFGCTLTAVLSSHPVNWINCWIALLCEDVYAYPVDEYGVLESIGRMVMRTMVIVATIGDSVGVVKVVEGG